MLDIKLEDIVIDVGGGELSYVPRLPCKKKYLQDIHISNKVKELYDQEVQFLECDACKIPLDDQSIDKICVHHSFEHFQKNSDTDFIHEVQRLLKPGGVARIIPIFLADHYLEITDEFYLDRKFDDAAKSIIDPIFFLPGGNGCGNYARVYDLNAFHRRVLSHIDDEYFKYEMIEIHLNNQPIPDVSLKVHRHITKINHPYRLLRITRKK